MLVKKTKNEAGRNPFEEKGKIKSITKFVFARLRSIRLRSIKEKNGSQKLENFRNKDIVKEEAEI